MNGHHLKLLKELSENNSQSQRELSQKLGLSLGSVNYVLADEEIHVILSEIAVQIQIGD